MVFFDRVVCGFLLLFGKGGDVFKKFWNKLDGFWVGMNWIVVNVDCIWFFVKFVLICGCDDGNGKDDRRGGKEWDFKVLKM